MTGFVKKLTAALLVVSIAMTAGEWEAVPVHAASKTECVDVTKVDAPLWSGPTKYSELVDHTYLGRVLAVVDETVNEYGNLWYEVAWEKEPGDGNTAFIYSGNVEPHTHGYCCLYVEGVEYSYCECGDVYVMGTSYVEVSQEDTYMMSTMAQAGILSLGDTALPFGDMVAGVLIIGTICLYLTDNIPTTLQMVTEEIDFLDYLKENPEVCTETNFRMVTRDMKNGLLVIEGDNCLTISEAYVYARFCGGDVWTPDKTGTSALACAELNGEFFGPEVDKDKPGYYYHYHMGTDHDNAVESHIFYGTGQYTGSYPVGY